MLFEAVYDLLESMGARYALIGGEALALRGYPRLTIDLDFLTCDRRVLNSDTWASLDGSGAHIEVRKGDLDDPLAGVVRASFGDERDVDVIVGRWKWEQGVIDRAERLFHRGVSLPVPM